MLAILPPEEDKQGIQRKMNIPWKKWDELSEMARRADTWGKGCGHKFMKPPFAFEFLLNSNIVPMMAISCPCLEKCEAFDEWLWYHDVHYIRRYTPPPTRPVNFQNSLVINGNGKIMGPFEEIEWQLQSQKLMDIFFKLVNEPQHYNATTKSFWWSEIFFRHNGDFVAGLYSRYTEIFQLLAKYLPNEYTR